MVNYGNILEEICEAGKITTGQAATFYMFFIPAKALLSAQPTFSLTTSILCFKVVNEQNIVIINSNFQPWLTTTYVTKP